MAKRNHSLVLLVLCVLAGAIIAGIWYTSGDERPEQRRGKASPMADLARLIDQRPLATARELARTANARGEGRLSREAVRLADQELDFAFESAMRDAQQHPSAPTAQSKQLREHIKEVEAQVKSDQQDVDRAKAALASNQRKDVEALQSELALAQAQLTLHTEELDDSKQDLLRSAADPYSRIQRLLAQHESAQHAEAETAPTKLPEFQPPGNLLGQVRTLRDLRAKQQRLLDAQQQAAAAANDLDQKHDEFERQLKANAATPQGSDSQSAISRLHQQAEDRKTLSVYGKRIQANQQLAQVYADWATLVGGQMRATLHAILKSLLWIVFIVLFVILAAMAVERSYARLTSDRRRIATMRMLTQFVLRGVGALLILFVLLGPPSQLSTVLALAGAGLTVALKDFIVAFFGWFALMGKNGIRVGDWVEINGIGGEVVEIGVFRTVLLETGNWGDSGHPTGRRVTFTNSFAIEGHYFNFSTSGQWLWDTLEVLVPTGRDPYPISEAMLQLVLKETEEDGRKAEQEWERATRDHGVRSFAATPTVDIRPSAQGFSIMVRYITQAASRYGVRSKLYHAVVELLHKKNIQDAQPVLPDVLTADAGQ
jgi:small-conductance mechanosensitive channel